MEFNFPHRVIHPPASYDTPPLIEDIFLSCSEPKRNVVEPSLVSVGTATMIHCRRCFCWWCVQDVRLKIAMHRCDVWTCMSAANAGWIVLSSNAQYCGDGAVQSPKVLSTVEEVYAYAICAWGGSMSSYGGGLYASYRSLGTLMRS